MDDTDATRLRWQDRRRRDNRLRASPWHAGCGWQAAGQGTEELMMRSELVVRGREGLRRIDRGPQRSTSRQ